MHCANESWMTARFSMKENAARHLRDGVHRRRVVIRAEAERVDRPGPVDGGPERKRHEFREVPVPDAGVLPVGEKDDAGHGIPVAAVGEHLGCHMEARADVRAATGDQGLHGALR
jgi:hypothetical protein